MPCLDKLINTDHIERKIMKVNQALTGRRSPDQVICKEWFRSYFRGRNLGEWTQSLRSDALSANIALRSKSSFSFPGGS
jgi:hypothetical protein